jgi:hypothetical protein
MEVPLTSEVFLPILPELQKYLEPHIIEINRRREANEEQLALAKSYGLEVFAGGINALWQLPSYLYEGLIATMPDAIPTSFQGGSAWPPFEWQDRSLLCFSSTALRNLYIAILDEFMQAHPSLDGICLGVGYDLYPFSCGCKKCQKMSYHDRFHEQVQLAYEVAVTKNHKKLWLWPWVTGGSSVIPGDDHYYGSVWRPKATLTSLTARMR